jgi:archaellum biogenesis ATPase FlaH
MNPLERTILRQLFGDKQFALRAAPYLKEKYFHSEETATIWRLYAAFLEKFRQVPSFAAIRIGLDATPSLNETQAKAAQDALNKVELEPLLGDSQTQWVLEQTELYCQDRAIFCALQDAIKVMDDPKQGNGTIPELMKEALSVTFDNHIGHDYFAEAMDRYDFYHKPESRVLFDIDTLNIMTAGGVPAKTLNVILAGTNVGKSLALVHFTAGYVRMSKNVLYITCEMAQEWIGQRVDANMFDIPMDDVVSMPRKNYESKINFLRQSSTGRLIIKEYPTATASCTDFRHLLQELRLKQNFVPDVIMVDYLSICSSMRVKLSGDGVNSYSFNKFIAEELRGLAGEFNVPLWTAAQFNREGFKSSDPGLEHVGESFGIPQTADFCFALVTTDEFDKLGQIALIELKNRYNRKKSYQQHVLGFDTPRMKIYELTGTAKQAAAHFTLPAAAPLTTGSGKPSLGAFANRKPGALASLRKENTNATPTTED